MSNLLLLKCPQPISLWACALVSELQSITMPYNIYSTILRIDKAFKLVFLPLRAEKLYYKKKLYRDSSFFVAGPYKCIISVNDCKIDLP